MSTIEHLHAPISDRPRPRMSAVLSNNNDKDDTNALCRRVVGSSFFWLMQLLPARRCEAIYALNAFYLELHDIADGEASRSLKQTLLLN